MNTIAVINQKGGVGKSTTALAIGAGLILKGYRTLGGIRASIYNSTSPESVETLVNFMESFRKAH